jgi:malate dehydrogenase (quinone)
MLDVIEKMYPQESAGWFETLKKTIPGLGKKLNADPKLAKKVLAYTAKALKLAS